MIEDLPPELEQLTPDDDAAARVAASSVPHPEWSWDTAPLEGENVRNLRIVRQWIERDPPPVYGLLLYGPAGLGKTGVAGCAIRHAAEARVGSNAAWMAATAPRIVEAVACGEFRKRPAPAQFYRWRDLKALLDAAKTGRLGYDEFPPLTADKVLHEIEERCHVVALDDVDVDAFTPWKEEVLLRLLEIPWNRRRLIITCNVAPADPAALARFGERVLDRLMDDRLFGRFQFEGRSLRNRHHG